MSKIVALRDAIQATIREQIPEFEEVSWHDGAFDDDEIKELGFRVPAAYVTVINSGVCEQISTGELNTLLRIYVNIVTSDVGKLEVRGSDPEVWDLMERVAVLANYETFDIEGCAPANTISFKRLRDPNLRREGIAGGCVEWVQALKIGLNVPMARDYLPDPTTTFSEVRTMPVEASMRQRLFDGTLSDPEIFDATLPEDEPRNLINEVF